MCQPALLYSRCCSSSPQCSFQAAAACKAGQLSLAGPPHVLTRHGGYCAASSILRWIALSVLHAPLCCLHCCGSTVLLTVSVCSSLLQFQTDWCRHLHCSCHMAKSSECSLPLHRILQRLLLLLLPVALNIRHGDRCAPTQGRCAPH